MKYSNQWFCGVEGQQFGPFTWEQMRGMAAEGRLVGESYVRRDVDSQWFQASQIPGLLPKAAASGSSSTIGKSLAAAGSKAASGTKSRAVANAPRAKALDSAPLAARGKEETHRAVKPAAQGGPSQSIPVGRPVAPPSVATAVTAAESPAVAVGPAAPFVLQTAPPAAGAPRTADPAGKALPEKKTGNAVILVAALGGVVAVVGVVGVGLLVWNSMRPAPTSGEKLAASIETDLQASLEQATAELEGNPLGVEIDPQAADELQGLADAASEGNLPSQQDGKNSQAAPPATPAAAAKLVASISNWTSVTTLRGIALNNLRLQLTSAWLATDEAGARVEPAADGQVHAAAKFVFVEVRVTNTAPVARKYKSWNATSGTSAVLAAPGSQVLTIVPPAATPGAKRLTEVSIPPGESITDQLVFAAPTGTIESLRLALAKSAFAEGAKFKSGSHFALEIPLEVLLTKTDSGADPRVGDPAVLANQAPAVSADAAPGIIGAAAEPAPAGDKPMPASAPAASAPAQAEMKKGDKPPSVDELNRQFEELSKEGEPAKNTEKKGEAQK